MRDRATAIQLRWNFCQQTSEARKQLRHIHLRPSPGAARHDVGFRKSGNQIRLEYNIKNQAKDGTHWPANRQTQSRHEQSTEREPICCLPLIALAGLQHRVRSTEGSGGPSQSGTPMLSGSPNGQLHASLAESAGLIQCKLRCCSPNCLAGRKSQGSGPEISVPDHQNRPCGS